MKVAVLEAAGNVGGAAVTDEFLPGFRNSAASYTVSLLNPKVIRDLELERHGLKVVLRKTDNFLPGDGDYLLAGRGGSEGEAQEGRFRCDDRSPSDDGRRTGADAVMLRYGISASSMPTQHERICVFRSS